MFELPELDKAVFDAAVGKDEKLMYCLPYNIEDDRFVSGYMVFTDKFIYKILEGELKAKFELAKMSDFTTEIMYGSCGFYAKVDGAGTLLCRFISGRNLPRYSVIVKACEILTETGNKEPVTNSEPERFCPKCGRPFMPRTNICPFCRSKKEIYSKLWGMTKGLRLMMMFPLIASMFSVFFRFIVPFIQKNAINNYIQPAAGVERGPMSSFIAVVIAIVTIDLLHRAMNVFQGRMAAVSGNKFSLMLRTLLFEKIEDLSLSSIQNKSTGDLMGRVNHDVDVVRDFIVGQIPSLFSQSVSFILGLALMLILDPMMSLFVFVPLPFAVWVISKFWSHIQKRNRKSWMYGRHTNRLLQDVLNGIRVVKSFGNEDREIERFEQYTERQARQDESNAKLFDTVFPLLGFFVKIGSFLILLYGNIKLFNGSMDIGTLNQFNTYANIIYEPLLYITFIPRNISNFLTSLGKVLEILEEKPEISDIDLPIDIKFEGNISIKDVTFGYESYSPVLKNISFDIGSGEMIGLVGHSGCGKTTLINLVMRMYDVSEGEISIDGVNIKDISRNALSSQIGAVLQETHLFSGTIRDNIRYSKPFATNREIIEAAKFANAHDFIVNLPEGYNTIVGEKGYSLSGGERQRIAIARALIHDPKILILDEATAALDTETEKMIQDALNNLMRNRTTIAIAHRLSTLRNADRLLVLDHGRIAEHGTHTELLEKKGIYYKLVMAQREAALPTLK